MNPLHRVLYIALRNVIAGIGALVFLFGDRFLREICHLSFLTSIIIWGCTLSTLLIAGVVIWHLNDW